MVSKDGSAKTKAQMKPYLMFPKKKRILKQRLVHSFYPPSSAHIALNKGCRVEVGKNFVVGNCLEPLALGGFLVGDGL